MHLLLLRHAEAEMGHPDEARQLSERGLQQAAAMAVWLHQNAPADLRVLVSPARRTQETAQAFTAQFETSAALSTASDADRLIAASGWPDGHGAVLIVGHQPTLGEVAAQLLDSRSFGLSLAPCELLWLHSDATDGSVKLLTQHKT